jgi:predicted nucleic acid-binding protein
MIVVDASVIVKWFVPEVGDAPAKALLDAPDALVAPDLARVEVASALVRKGLRRELAVTDAERALGAWLRMVRDGQLVLLPNADDIEVAAKLAFELQHALPDCLYLAAAERLGATLVTADQTFARKAQPGSGRIRLLAAPR